jgi:hypothetical protein
VFLLHFKYYKKGEFMEINKAKYWINENGVERKATQSEFKE